MWPGKRPPGCLRNVFGAPHYRRPYPGNWVPSALQPVGRWAWRRRVRARSVAPTHPRNQPPELALKRPTDSRFVLDGVNSLQAPFTWENLPCRTPSDNSIRMSETGTSRSETSHVTDDDFTIGALSERPNARYTPAALGVASEEGDGATHGWKHSRTDSRRPRGCVYEFQRDRSVGHRDTGRSPVSGHGHPAPA